MHPAIAPMIERNAFIGGCEGRGDQGRGADRRRSHGHDPALAGADGRLTPSRRCGRSTRSSIPSAARALIDTPPGREVRGHPRHAEALGRISTRSGSTHTLVRAAAISSHPQEVRLGARSPRLSHVRLIASGVVRRVRDSRAQPRGGRLRVGTSIASAPRAELRARHHGDRRPAMAKRGKWSGPRTCCGAGALPARRSWSRPGRPRSRVVRRSVGADAEPLLTGGRSLRDLPAAPYPPRLRPRSAPHLPMDTIPGQGLRRDF